MVVKFQGHYEMVMCKSLRKIEAIFDLCKLKRGQGEGEVRFLITILSLMVDLFNGAEDFDDRG